MVKVESFEPIDQVESMISGRGTIMQLNEQYLDSKAVEVDIDYFQACDWPLNYDSVLPLID